MSEFCDGLRRVVKTLRHLDHTFSLTLLFCCIMEHYEIEPCNKLICNNTHFLI